MNIFARKVLNSRKQATIEVNYYGNTGSAPSGTSVSKYEIKPYLRSINREIAEFNRKAKLIEKIKVNEFQDLEKIESFLKRFGANTVIALEFAILKYHHGYKWLNGKKLPRPLGNCIGGGLHSKAASTNFQEFLVIDKNSESFFEAAFKNNKAHRLAHELLEQEDKNFKIQFNDEGAWITKLEDEVVLSIMQRIANNLNLKIGLDIASSYLWNGKFYVYKNKKLSKKDQIKFVNRLINKFKLYYIEDALHEDDFSGFSELDKECLIAGDDLIATNLSRLKNAINKESINAVIIKPNQIGSLIKMKEVIELAKKNNIIPIMSHRSGETLDNSISHLAVGFNIPIIKCGIYGKERLAKINELVRIEKEIS